MGDIMKRIMAKKERLEWRGESEKVKRKCPKSKRNRRGSRFSRKYGTRVNAMSEERGKALWQDTRRNKNPRDISTEIGL